VTAHEAQNSSKLSLFDYYIKFLPALFLPLVSLFAALQLDSESRWMILSVAALWLLAPLVGWIAAKPYRSVSRNLSEDDKNYALGIAKNTWHYFDKYLNQKYNYLIPDNLQTVPVDTVAERTSPTNISLSVLALLSAYDLGFISLPQFIERSAKVFDTLSRLERYHGHFFNWYDINSLAVLNPRYISSVDSGNLLGHFVALRSELKSLDKNALVTRNYFSNLTSENFTLQDLYQRSKNSAENEEDKALLQVLLGWIDKIKILKELAKNGKLPRKLEKIDHVIERRKATLSLLHKLIRRLLRIETVTSLNQEEQAQVQELIVALKEANQKIELLFKAVQKIVELIDLFEGEMDFKFLYDEERGLLSIGYRCDIGQRDRSYYDLLASEARLASLVAIAKGDLPEKHWFMLGRNLTDAAGSISLLSWSGTMFEYLMPLIVTKDFPETLLSYTYQAVVKAQRRYGARRGVPWGISESGFSGVDFHRTYQYNAFGVPGLGLKRGLADDLVISPYSSLLAVMIEPHAALQNLRRIEQIGGRGELGFFEALDFTPERLRNDENCHMVRSFFAHHQGMSLAAINNLLNSGILQKRFHSDSLIKAYEILLHEQFPKRVSLILPHQAEVLSLGEKHEAQRVDASQRFENALSPTPKLRLLSNRRLSTVIDDAGNGGTFLTDNIQLTRYRTDEQFGRFGFYIYIKNLKNKKFWSTTYQPTLVEPDTQEIFFNFDKVEFKRRDQDISLHSEITVSPEDNVEIRRVKISNHNTKDKAQLELTSFAEVSLNSFQSDLAHQAFTKLFIESEFLEEYDALIFTKRPRSEKDKTIFLAHAVTMPLVWAPCQYTTSRESFIGRGHDLSSPQAMLSHERLDQRCGYVIDPIMSLRVLVELEANRSLDVAFIMITANSREECLRLLSKYREPHFVERAFELSWSHSDIEVRHEMFAGGKVAAYQELIKALLYPIEELKAPQSLAKRNQLAQNALWRFGISGDEAIVLIEAGNGDSLALVDELLQAHEYLKQRGIRFDLVILNDDPGGYLQELQNEITHLVNLRFAREKLDQRGGVFIRSSFKLSADELCLLYASARIYLKSSQGSLEERLAEVGSQSNKHHQALAQRNNSQIVKWASLPREIREFDNKLGGFVNDGTAYALNVSMKNLPPKPWSNLVALPNFGFLVTERGGGYTWAGNSRENRLTPWENDAVIDLPHEVVYIRDLETMQYWSPTPISPQAEVKVTHAAGFSRFDSLVNNLSTRLTLTIDHQHSIKWFALDMTNNQLDERSFEFILYLDFVLGINKEQTEQYLNFNYQKQSERLEIRNSFNIEFGNGCAWIGSSEKIKGFSTLRAEFLGRHSRVDAPNLLESSRFERQSVSSKLSNRVASGSDRCGVLVSQLKLTPGENKKILFYLAYTQDPSQIDQIDKQAKSLKRYEAALIWHANEWRERCGVIKVKTPERSFDILVNHWLLYQTLACRIFARTGLYQSSGAIGFRDQLQDSLAALYANPTLTRSQILLNASRQFKEGDVQHWWHPPSGRGVRTLISDNYIWLIYATARYVKFTADLSILDVEVPFLHGDPIPEGAHDFYFTPTATVESATLYQHCKLAIERALTKLSERGIPLIGGGDWNDGLSQVGPEGRGESTWLGWFLVTALKEFSPLVEGVEGGAASERLKACADEISTAIDQYCWNGEWYERATFDDGTPLGVKGRSECEIDSIAQSWSVLSKEDLTKSGDLPPHSRLAIESAYQHLFDKQHQVIRLLWPPFDKSKPHPGYIQGYPPGVRENGGQYTHAATWLIAAFARAGDGERALELFNAANPILHTFTPELVSTYQAEPYALCGDVLSAGELAGRAGWSWYTGSSAWLYRVAIEEILGIKIQGWQIKFQPAVPKSWKQFFVAITLKGVKLELDFKRHKVATEESATFTVQVLTKDAEVEEDCLILPDAAGKVIKAEVLF
jgi:cellobiose phosphorylase